MSTPACCLYSTDPAWCRRVEAFLAPVAAVRRVDTAGRLESELERLGGGVLLLDLQSEGAVERLPELLKAWPRGAVVACGLSGSDPVRQAETLGVYAVADRQVDRRWLVALVQRALEHVAVREENRLLREAAARLSARADAVQTPPAGPAPMEAQQLAKALRHFDNVEALLQRLADEVASALLVARVGIFCRGRDIAGYRLRAGLRCLENTSELDFREDDPLAVWLARQGHVVSRANLEHAGDPAARLMLARALDQFGAEIIVPLQSREHLLGWLFVGHLSTGFPYERAHIENLIEITDCVSTTLENALLYEEVAVQKSLAETLLHAMPTGILAADVRGTVRWFNETAQAMLHVPPEAVLNRPVESLGSRLADVLRRTLAATDAGVSEEWIDPVLRRCFSVRARRLLSKSQCLGAVAIVQDLTEQKALKEAQDRLERATFWAELAASMSHEVRNPLVAIKTFAQLLPERYQDPEFQSEFRDLVSREVDRLNGIIDQINDFAHPSRMEFRTVDLRACVDKAVAAVLPPDRPAPVRLDLSVPADLPRLSGDERALTEAVAHLVRNAVEALAGREQGVVRLRARPIGDALLSKCLELTVEDNGPGVSDEMREKLFSPFATTKARGLGLGLPIVNRTVVDHRGRVRVESSGAGTRVVLVLPLTAGESAP